MWGAGDEVITMPFSFDATAEMIALLGAVPVYTDIDSRTYNLAPTKIEAANTPRTKAISMRSGDGTNGRRSAR